MKRLIFVIMLTIASSAAVLAQAERIGTRQWKLTQLDGVNVLNLSRAYIELDQGQVRFTGNTGCNRMFGTVTYLQGRRVDFSNVGTTKMACTDARMRRLETAFVRALENVDRYRQRGNSLELMDRNRVVMRFTAATKEQPDNGGNGRVDLEDRKWMLNAIKGIPVSKAGQAAFVVFDKQKGSAGGNSNCNVFGGSYTSNAGRISVTDVISTMRACEEGNRMTIERQFLDGLRNANRYEIKVGRLMLYRNKQLLLTFVGVNK